MCASTRPYGQGCEPGDAALGLAPAFAPTWLETFGQPRARAGTAWLLQNRPRCGGRGPSGAQPGPSVAPRMLWCPGRGDPTTPPPAPVGNGRSGAGRRARRDGGWCPCPARCVRGTRLGPRGAWRSCGASARGRSASGHQRCAPRGRRPWSGGQPDRHTVRRRLPAWRCRRSSGRWLAGGPGWGSAGPAPSVPRVGAGGVGGGAVQHGSHASRPESPRRWAPCRRAGRSPSWGRRWSHFWPGRRAGLA